MGLGATLFHFGWLMRLGMSFAVRTWAHLGVNAVIQVVGPGARRIFALMVAAQAINGTM